MRLRGWPFHIIDPFFCATFRESEIEGRLKIYLFCSFHIGKLFRQYPLTSTALFSGVVSAVVGLGLLLYWSDQHRDFDEALHRARRAPPLAPSFVSSTVAAYPQLPFFSSAEFTGQLAAAASEMGLRSDDVTYALDTGAGQPYWRYRISLKVQSGYPTIRKFLAAVASEFPNVVLDSIQCQRENSATVPLKCELALSAFFGKSGKNG